MPPATISCGSAWFGNSTQVLYEELGSGDNDSGSWDFTSVDITSFANQSVYLLVEAADAAVAAG